MCVCVCSVKVKADLLDDADWYDVQTGLAGWAEPVILKKMLQVLERGLGKRVQLIAEWPYPSVQVACLLAEWTVWLTVMPVWLWTYWMQWPVETSPRSVTCKGHVTLGVLYDPTHSFDPLELGPPADSAEVSLTVVLV